MTINEFKPPPLDRTPERKTRRSRSNSLDCFTATVSMQQNVLTFIAILFLSVFDSSSTPIFIYYIRYSVLGTEAGFHQR